MCKDAVRKNSKHLVFRSPCTISGFVEDRLRLGNSSKNSGFCLVLRSPCTIFVCKESHKVLSIRHRKNVWKTICIIGIEHDGGSCLGTDTRREGRGRKHPRNTLCSRRSHRLQRYTLRSTTRGRTAVETAAARGEMEGNKKGRHIQQNMLAARQRRGHILWQ